MHCPDTTPRPSLYYRYRVHPAWLPPAPAQPSAQQPVPQPSPQPLPTPHPVLIAGSGPAGLVTALVLARHGVPSIIVTPDVQVGQGSRAIVFTRRTLEILQQVGTAERMTQHGLPWRSGHSHYRGQRVYRMDAPHDDDDRFHPMLNLQQPYLEEFLLDACAATPLIDLRWGNRVVGVAQQADRVSVKIDTPAGPYTQDSHWLVAADGGRSPIRSALGLQMEGASYEGVFVIADIQVDLPLPTERLAFFDPAWNPGNTILMHRQPQGLWRVDYQLPPGESAEQALQPASLKARIDAQLAMIGHAGAAWTLDWSSVYSARTLTLPDYRHGRVLFAGDAAHLLPIFGVRGANTAFQDAQSLGWHLALVVQGLAGPALLDNYSTERVAAAREIIDEAGKSTRFMAPPSRGFRLLRDAVLSLSLTEDFVRPLYHWRTSRPHAYTRSMLNSRDDDNEQFKAGPAPGAPPQNIRLGPDEFLLDHLARLAPGFTLLCFTDADTAALSAPVQQVLAAQRARGLPLQVIAIGSARPVAGCDLSLADADGHARQRYGVPASGAAYLLRPDQHVCARWLSLDAARLQAALDTALGLGPAVAASPA